MRRNKFAASAEVKSYVIQRNADSSSIIESMRSVVKISGQVGLNSYQTKSLLSMGIFDVFENVSSRPAIEHCFLKNPKLPSGDRKCLCMSVK